MRRGRRPTTAGWTQPPRLPPAARSLAGGVRGSPRRPPHLSRGTGTRRAQPHTSFARATCGPHWRRPARSASRAACLRSRSSAPCRPPRLHWTPLRTRARRGVQQRFRTTLKRTNPSSADAGDGYRRHEVCRRRGSLREGEADACRGDADLGRRLVQRKQRREHAPTIRGLGGRNFGWQPLVR